MGLLEYLPVSAQHYLDSGNKGWIEESKSENNSKSAACLPQNPNSIPAWIPSRTISRWDSSICERRRYHQLRNIEVNGLKPRGVTVYLPADYEISPYKRYPVVYAHDGQFSLHQDLAVGSALDTLTERGIIEPHILVAIDRTNDRSRELKPVGRDSQYIPSLERYGRLLVDKIKPLIDSSFRTRQDRNSTALVGYSLGGLANLYLYMKYPDVFGSIACMSPSLWWRNRILIDSFSRYRGELPKRLWIDAGTLEGRRWERIPYFISNIRKARDLALEKGMRLGKDLGYLEDPGAPHAAWAGGRRMRYALAFLLSTVRPGQGLPTQIDLYVFRTHLSSRTRVTNMSVNVYYGNVFLLTWPNNRVTLSSTNQDVISVQPDGTLVAHGFGVADIEANLGFLHASQAIFVESRKDRLKRHRRKHLASASTVVQRQ